MDKNLLGSMYICIITTAMVWKTRLKDDISLSNLLSEVFELLDEEKDVQQFVDDIATQLHLELADIEEFSPGHAQLIIDTLAPLSEAFREYGMITDENPTLGRSAVGDKSFIMFAEDEETEVNNMTDKELKDSIKDLFN